MGCLIALTCRERETTPELRPQFLKIFRGCFQMLEPKTCYSIGNLKKMREPKAYSNGGSIIMVVVRLVVVAGPTLAPPLGT